MVYYKLVKVTIDVLSFAEIIINIVVRYHGLPNFIVPDWGLLFTSKFWSSLCYFLNIKQRLFTAFQQQTNGLTKRENSTMEAYLQAFVNFKQNNWAQLLPMAEFTYNNAKNVSTGHISFKFNCKYHPWVFHEEDLDPRSKLKTMEELSSKLQNLIAVSSRISTMRKNFRSKPTIKESSLEIMP